MGNVRERYFYVVEGSRPVPFISLELAPCPIKKGYSKTLERRQTSANEVLYENGQRLGQFFVFHASSSFCKGLFEALVDILPELYSPLNGLVAYQELVAPIYAQKSEIEDSEDILDMADLLDLEDVLTTQDGSSWREQ